MIKIKRRCFANRETDNQTHGR